MRESKKAIRTGVVYVYKNNSLNDPEFGWAYVGSTLSEDERRRKWNNPKTKNYGGKKITEARLKYGPSAFSYQVLARLTGEKKTLREELFKLEAEFIEQYNSTEFGYNTSKGKGNRGVKKSAEEITRRTATRKKNGVNYAHTPSKFKNQKRDPSIGKKIAASLSHVPKLGAHKAALRKSLKGKPHPEWWTKKAIAARMANNKPYVMSAQGKAKINANRFKIPIVATNDKKGYSKEFDSMKAASEELGIKTGSIHHFLKTGNANKDGYKFAYKGGIKNQPKKSKGKDKGQDDGSGNVAA